MTRRAFPVEAENVRQNCQFNKETMVGHVNTNRRALLAVAHKTASRSNFYGVFVL